MKYPWLLGINLFISNFTFGGGYVVVPMMRKYYMREKGLLPEGGLMEMAAIAQSSPGAIAINLSGLTGYWVGGVPGAVISCLVAVIPPLVALLAISLWCSAFSSNPVVAAILGGMKAGVAALIVDLVTDIYQMIVKERSRLLTTIIPISFLVDFVRHVNMALVLTACCGVCVMKI